MSFKEASERLEGLLVDSVRSQLLSDVPVGAFLSGGVDSSLIVAIMARSTGRPVPTFSIGFAGARPGLDESRWARLVSRHLGTEHHELTLPADVLEGLEGLASALDEPIADSAILPTSLLAGFARRTVKVVLTGEGADELFAGYNRYKPAYLSERLLAMPAWRRRLLIPLARRLGKGPLYDGIAWTTLREWAEANRQSPFEAVRGVCGKDFLESAGECPGPFDSAQGAARGAADLNGVLAFDIQTVLADGLLMKVDKATMGASLEARVPFLDRRLVEFALRIPPQFKLRGLKGKYLLRRLAAKYLPRAVAFRRKHGFVVPWEDWVRNPGRGGVDGLIADPALAARGIFDIPRLAQMRRALVSGDRRVDAGIFFRVAVLGLWLRSLEDFKTAPVVRKNGPTFD